MMAELQSIPRRVREFGRSLFLAFMVGYPVLHLPRVFMYGITTRAAWTSMVVFVVGVFFVAMAVPLALLVVPYRRDKTKFRRAIVAWTLAVLSLQPLAMVMQTVVNDWVSPHVVRMTLATFFSFSLIFDLITAIALLLAVLAVATEEEALQTELRARELQNVFHREEMEALMAQLHPHFLFNTLNAVIALLETDRDAARRTLHRLRTLLDQHVVALEPMATVADEMRIVDTYLDIECTRFGEQLHATTEIAAGVANVLMPRLLLQPLVENAVRHGVRGSGSVRVRVRRDEGMLEAEIMDSGCAMRSAPGSGIGLSNARRRLELLYGTRYRLDLTTTNDGTVVILRVPPVTAAG